MNTTVLKQIGFMALGAVITRGAGGFFPATTNPKIVHAGLAIATGLAAMKVSDSNSNIKNALIGATLVKSLDLGKVVFEASPVAQNLASKTDKASAFLRSATGLGCPCDNGLGYANEEEEYYLNGSEEVYVDEAGNVIGLGYADDEDEVYLNGSMEHEYGLNSALEAEYGIS